MRSSELKLLDLCFMRILPEEAEFQLSGLTKTSSEVISVLFAIYECKKLCVLRCLQCYITRTDSFRPAQDPNIANQVPLSYRRPCHPVQPIEIIDIECVLLSFLSKNFVSTKWRIYKGILASPRLLRREFRTVARSAIVFFVKQSLHKDKNL